jgi:hypothetical protein
VEFVIGRQRSVERGNQRRRGRFKWNKAESPGEKPRLEIRNAIRTDGREKDGEFRIEKSE